MSTTLSLSDATWGYPIGVDGYMTESEVREFLSIARSTVWALRTNGLIRTARIPNVGVRYCRRSVMDHARSGEE